jgi:glycosyltransferase involved in cell wall biosynthesis
LNALKLLLYRLISNRFPKFFAENDFAKRAFKRAHLSQILDSSPNSLDESLIGQNSSNGAFQSDHLPYERSLVNISMVTFNRLEFTRQAIQALLLLDAGHHYVLTVVDNGSGDGTREYLQDLKNNLVIKNLVLLDENVGVAKASNLAWSMEPHADYYLKLDNDIVIQKAGWLEKMVNVVDLLQEAGVVAYNFEPTSYPLISLHGVSVRPKLEGNLGGACILIPQRTHQRFGFWCEDYGLYGEEDADLGARIKYGNLFSVYMDDEQIGIHLPAGRAATVNIWGKSRDGIEEVSHSEYRAWKDKTRRWNLLSGTFRRNRARYKCGGNSLYVRSIYVENYYKLQPIR